MLDEIDQELLRQCEENPGQTVAAIISPLLGTRKERTLHDRIAALEAKQLIVIDRIPKNKGLFRYSLWVTSGYRPARFLTYSCFRSSTK